MRIAAVGFVGFAAAMAVAALVGCGGSRGGKTAPIVDPDPKPNPEPEPEPKPLMVSLQIYNAGDTWVQSIYLHPTKSEQPKSGEVTVICGCPGKYGYYRACDDCTAWKNIWIEPGETRDVGNFQSGSYDFSACFGEYYDRTDGLYGDLDYPSTQYSDVILDYYEHGAVLVLPDGIIEPRVPVQTIYWNVLIENNTNYPWKAVYWRPVNPDYPECWKEFGPVAYSEHCEILHQAEGLYDFAWKYDNPDAKIVVVRALPIPFPFLSENGWTIIDQGTIEDPLFMGEPDICTEP